MKHYLVFEITYTATKKEMKTAIITEIKLFTISSIEIDFKQSENSEISDEKNM